MVPKVSKISLCLFSCNGNANGWKLGKDQCLHRNLVSSTSAQKKNDRYLVEHPILASYIGSCFPKKLQQTPLSNALRSINMRLNSLKRSCAVKKVYFQHDNNAETHIAKIIKEKLATFDSDPPYSRDYAPSNHYLFRS